MQGKQRTKSVVRAAKREANRPVPQMPTADSYQNLVTRTGFGTDNQDSYGTYGFYPITRMRMVLDFAYRSSWLCRAAVQSIAEDMTREGFDLGSDMKPEETDIIYTAFNKKFFIWDKLGETIQWARLYGGAGAYIMIDGQDPASPLRLDTLGKNSFCGLLPLDRWMLDPSLNDLVVDQRHQDYGKPKYYRVVGDTPLPPSIRIHHTRFLRFEGDNLPYYQKLSENLWGMSVLEPIWDRLLAFDKTTAGTAQLVNRAHLRNLYIEKWKETVGTGGDLLTAQLAAIDWMRRYQNNEGITILDSTDKLEALSYTFTGLDAVLIQMGQQLSGGIGVPLVRLFGQSPAGLNSTGESDIRNYYDTVKTQQERRLRSGVETLVRVVAISESVQIPKGFNFSWRPLWQLKDNEKADISGTVTTQVGQAFSEGIIGRGTALKELKQMSHITGIWSNITDEEIEEAENEPPVQGMGEPPQPDFLPGAAGAGQENQSTGATEQKPVAKPSFLPGGTGQSVIPGGSDNGDDDSGGSFGVSEFERSDRKLHKSIHLHLVDQNHPGRHVKYAGHEVVIEVEKDQPRYDGSSGGAIMAAPYGYFPNTIANDGDVLDVFLGPNEQSTIVFVIDQQDPDTKQFHQPKVFLGFNKSNDVVDVFKKFYADGRGGERLGQGHELSIREFPQWLEQFRKAA